MSVEKQGPAQHPADVAAPDHADDAAVQRSAFNYIEFNLEDINRDDKPLKDLEARVFEYVQNRTLGSAASDAVFEERIARVTRKLLRQGTAFTARRALDVAEGVVSIALSWIEPQVGADGAVCAAAGRPAAVDALAAVLDPQAVLYVFKPSPGYCRTTVTPEEQWGNAARKWVTSIPSESFAEMVTRFGSVYGGFDTLLGHAARCPSLVEATAALQIVQDIVSAEYIVRDKLPAIGALTATALNGRVSRLVEMPADELKAVAKADIEKLFYVTGSLLDATLPAQTVGTIVEPAYLAVALRCFKCQTFDKRIYGLQAITAVVSWIRNAETLTLKSLNPLGTPSGSTSPTAGPAPAPSPPKSTKSPAFGPMPSPHMASQLSRSARFYDGATLAKWMCDNDIIDALYGPSAHVELVKRSSEVLRFMSREHALSEAHVDVLWNAALHHHESVAHETLRVIAEEAPYVFSPENRARLVSHLGALPPRTLSSPPILSLARDLAMRCETHRDELLEMLWAIVALRETFKSHSFKPLRLKWLERATQQLDTTLCDYKGSATDITLMLERMPLADEAKNVEEIAISFARGIRARPAFERGARSAICDVYMCHLMRALASIVRRAPSLRNVLGLEGKMQEAWIGFSLVSEVYSQLFNPFTAEAAMGLLVDLCTDNQPNFYELLHYLSAHHTGNFTKQDVDEFFNILWQRLEQGLKQTPHWAQLNRVFVGQTADRIKSIEPSKPYESERVEDFVAIPLDIKGKRNIQEALDLFVAKDKLEGDNAVSSEAFGKVNATKHLCIKRLPPTLIFNLKRFEFDFNTNTRQKLNDLCEFPEALNMRPWTKEGMENQPLTDEQAQPGYYDYKLVGVLVHSGGADAGHYYSYIKNRQTGLWYEFNDQLVDVFDPEQLSKECFGGKQMVTHWDNFQRVNVRREYDKVRSAYMLFYERDELPSERAGDVLPTETSVIPEPLLEEIESENIRFLRDMQFFDETYFSFLHDILALHHPMPDMGHGAYDSVLDEDVLNDPSFVKAKLGAYFFVDVLLRAKNSGVLLKPWVNVLSADFTTNVAACKWFVQMVLHRNLLQEVLLDCPNERARVAMADLIGTAFRILSPREMQIWNAEETLPAGESYLVTKDLALAPRAYGTRPVSLSQRAIDALINHLEAARPSWKRIKQYFRVFADFASISHNHRQFLLDRDLPNMLSDWFMGDTGRAGMGGRVQVMDDRNLPDLTDLFSTLSILVCGCFQGANGQTESPYSQSPPLLPPPVCVSSLIRPPFIKSMMEMDYNRDATLRMLKHFSWNDVATTTHIVNQILLGLRNSDIEKISVWHAIIEGMIEMEDQHQELRTEMLLSPYASPRDPQGLISIMADTQQRYPAVAYLHVKFLLHLNEIPCVREYLYRIRSEITWIGPFLQSRLHLPPDVLETILVSDEKCLPPDRARWRRDSGFISFMAVRQMERDYRNREQESGPGASKEEDLAREVEKLREALYYYTLVTPSSTIGHPYTRSQAWLEWVNRKYPTPSIPVKVQADKEMDQYIWKKRGVPAVPPINPKFMKVAPPLYNLNGAGTEDGDSCADGESSCSEDTVVNKAASVSQWIQSNPARGTGMQPSPEPDPPNAKDCVASICDLLPHVTKDQAIEALRKNFWNVDATVNSLLDTH
eukprot:m51a1_g5970 putative ubiquitin domain-containing protein (1649) ;mRNA; f:219026-227559